MMKTATKLIYLMLMMPCFSYGSNVSYKAIESFHETKINAIEKEYSLKNRMEISVSLAPKFTLTEDKDQKVIKLPGLLLDVVALNQVKEEIGLVEIIDALKDYKRKIVFLRGSKVSDKELKVVQQAVQDELFLENQNDFVVKEWSANTTISNFRERLYSGVLISPKMYMSIMAFLIIAFSNTLDHNINKLD